jgi:hypothetical protein
MDEPKASGVRSILVTVCARCDPAAAMVVAGSRSDGAVEPA